MIVPTAEQVALAIVGAAQRFGVDPDRAFDKAAVYVHTRVLAAVSLVEAQIASQGPAAKALGFKYKSALVPSRIRDLGLTEADWGPIVRSLHDAGHAPLGRAVVIACSAWSDAEMAVLREGIAAGLNDKQIAAELPGRSRYAVKKLRLRELWANNHPVQPGGPQRPFSTPERMRGALVSAAKARTERERIAAIPPTTGDVPVNLSHTGSHGWTDERLAAVKQHFLLGLSAERSAALLGVSKNMVVSRRVRMALDSRHPGFCLKRAPRRDRKRPVKTAPPKPAPKPQPEPVVVAAPAPQPKPEPFTRSNGIHTAQILPLAFHRSVAPPVPLEVTLAERIAAALRKHGGALTPLSLAYLCDAKELAVSQALALMEREGLAEPGPMPPEGRRSRCWSLTLKAGAAA